MRLRLPATSANLGPAFDAAAVALELFLEIEAEAVIEAEGTGEFFLKASGRNVAECEAIEGNLLLETYREILMAEERLIIPLSLRINNEVPLGMGLGSSAAARLAGVALAVHFGGLHWNEDRILSEASRREGHPDNAGACWLGGFVTSVTSPEGDTILSARFEPPSDWHAVVVLPKQPLATTRARGVLPETVLRKDAVANVQRAALLTAAFASGRGDLLREAMADRLHQPYRGDLCPLLERLLPLAGGRGVLGVALSGAGPGVLCIVESVEAACAAELEREILRVAGEPVEIQSCALTRVGARESYSTAMKP